MGYKRRKEVFDMKKTQKRNFLITIISAIVTIFGVLNLGGGQPKQLKLRIFQD